MQLTTFTDPQKTAFLVGAVNKSNGKGKSTLSDPSGRVYSLQPDLTWGDRDAGADGAFEQCTVDGQTATYWYQWHGAVVGPVTVAFFLVSNPS